MDLWQAQRVPGFLDGYPAVYLTSPGHEAGGADPGIRARPGLLAEAGTGTVGRTSEAQFSEPGRGTTPPRHGPETPGSA
jgi:hypothetical protein